jgi:hypothetical protein
MNELVKEARRHELKESQAAVRAGLKPSKKDRKAARARAFKARLMAETDMASCQSRTKLLDKASELGRGKNQRRRAAEEVDVNDWTPIEDPPADEETSGWLWGVCSESLG